MKTVAAEKAPVTDFGPRCEAVNAANGATCNRLLAWQVTRPWAIDCTKCGSTNKKS